MKKSQFIIIIGLGLILLQGCNFLHFLGKNKSFYSSKYPQYLPSFRNININAIYPHFQKWWEFSLKHSIKDLWVYNEEIYIFTENNYLIKADLRKKEILWMVNTHSRVGFPLFVSHTITALCDLNFLYLLDSFSGRVLSIKDLKIVLRDGITGNKDKILISDEEQHIYMYERLKNKIIRRWVQRVEGNLVSHLLVDNDKVYYTTENGYIGYIDIDVGEQKKSFHCEGTPYYGLAIYNNYVFSHTTSYKVYCLYKYALQEKWVRIVGFPVDKPYVIDNKLLISTKKGLKFLDIENGNLLFSFPDIGRFIGKYKEYIFIQKKDKLTILNIKTKKVIQSIPLPNLASIKFTRSGFMVGISGDRRKILAYQIKIK